jgi:predicted AlkP superfamily pyrophosphatase or phosphodiesterase
LRRLLAEGDVVEGVVGEDPTVTWPAHTTLITGVPPSRHGILGNRRPDSQGGGHYWEASLLKAPTLWHRAKAAGLTVGAVTWPVTVTPQIDFDLPEYFDKRHGGGMDLTSVASKATPGLVDRIVGRYPSFRQQWINDRTRSLAALYMTRDLQTDLTLLHFVDLDSEAHERGPFTVNANAVVEYTDELIGNLLTDSPSDLTLALVSDHGFERTDRALNLSAWLVSQGLSTWLAKVTSWLGGGRGSDGLIVTPGLVATRDPTVADALAREAGQAGSPIGRRVPPTELARWAPAVQDVLAAFEPADHVVFVRQPDSSDLYVKPGDVGTHHFWPGRPGFRSVFVLWGPGIHPQREPEISILDICGRLGRILGIAHD